MKKQIINYEKPAFFKSAIGIAKLLEQYAFEIYQADIHPGNPYIRYTASINELWVEEDAENEILKAIETLSEEDFYAYTEK